MFSVRKFALVVFFWVIACSNAEKTFEDLEKMLFEAKSYRKSRGFGEIGPVWMEYEFESGAGNREEIVMKKIAIFENPSLPRSIENWQFSYANGDRYLARSDQSSLYFYPLDFSSDSLLNDPIILSANSTILQFKIIVINHVEIVAVVYVESDSGRSLKWFRFLENEFQIFWTLPVQKHLKEFGFIQTNTENRILLLEDNDSNFGKQFSPVDICSIRIDFRTQDYGLWLCEGAVLPKTFSIRVCSTRERNILALQGVNEIYLTEYVDTTNGPRFEDIEPVKAHGLRNFVCFESGYIEYLATSGPQAGLYNFLENEFQYNHDSEKHFEITDISWVLDIPIDTYREESILLIQLENSSVIALTWQGSSFERISLPSEDLDGIDLSRATAIPKFGLISGNRFLRFDIELRELRRPIHDDIERIVKLQTILKEIFEHQEKILDETESRIEKSYLKNPSIKGNWNLSIVNAENVNVSKSVDFGSVAIGSTNLTDSDLYFDPKTHRAILVEIEKDLEEIESNLNAAWNSETDEFSEIHIFGDLNVIGSLNAGNLTVETLNGIPVKEDSGNIVEKTETIQTENFQAAVINGIPISQINFGKSRINYEDVDFDRIEKIVINGSLEFSIVNNVLWQSLIGNVIWTDRPTIVSGKIVIDGTIIADDVDIDFLNQQKYPEDFVAWNATGLSNVTGTKIIDRLTVSNLLGVDRLNDLAIDEFVTLNGKNQLDQRITFNELTIEDFFKVDDNATNYGLDSSLPMEETLCVSVSGDIIFANLNVSGEIVLEESISGRNWSEFEDLLQKSEEIATVIGCKKFLSNVNFPANLNITSNLINNASIDEFLTLDTEQTLSNLERIRSDVTFGKVHFGALEKLEKCNRDSENYYCMENFRSENRIIVDELIFERIDANISREYFENRLKNLFEELNFGEVSAENIFAEEIQSELINNFDISKSRKDLRENLLEDEIIVENLEVDVLNATSINNINKEDLENLENCIGSFFENISQGNLEFDSLEVRGKIVASTINDRIPEELAKMNESGTIIFEKDVSIENLNILGLFNNYNFSEKIADTVLKTNNDISFAGRKKFRKINCRFLESEKFNGHLIEDLFDPRKAQIITGPLTVNGGIEILKDFESKGKINGITFKDLKERFAVSNNTYRLQGNFYFPNKVEIGNLNNNVIVGGRYLDDFLDSLITPREDNLIVDGRKIFKNILMFNDTLSVIERLNNLDLKSFYDNAVFTDESFSLKSKLSFENGIQIEGDLIVKDSLAVGTVKQVNFEELKTSVIYLNRPTSILESMKFAKVVFEKNIFAKKINGIEMDLAIPLHTEQTIPVDLIKCKHVTFEEFEISGNVNSHDLDSIYTNTVMLTGNQNITGNLRFHGKVFLRQNFNPKLLNDVDPARIVSCNSKEPLIGNFSLEKVPVFSRSLRVLGGINNVDIKHWETLSISKLSKTSKEIVSGKWKIYGNIIFENSTENIDKLQGTNFTEALEILEQRVSKIEQGNLSDTCQSLEILKNNAANQIYQFRGFERVQTLELDTDPISVNHFELDNSDYLFVSRKDCRMDAFLFNGEKFETVATVENFGKIDKWIFRNDGVLYFLTSSEKNCTGNSANLWKLENDLFSRILELGSKTRTAEIKEDAFLSLIQEKLVRRSIIEEELREVEDQNSLDEDDENVLNFKAGIFQRDLYLFYDEKLTEDNIFICNHDVAQKKIVQTLSAHKPNFFHVLNLENTIETLLIFAENESAIRIYEYKGIEGFIYRDIIKGPVKGLFPFKIRKFSNFTKKHFLAVSRNNRVVIFEGKMHGEKLDLSFSCPKN